MSFAFRTYSSFTKICLFLGSIFIALLCTDYAVAGLYPVVTSITAIGKGNGTVEYHFRQVVMDIGPASETPLPPNRYKTVLGAKSHNGAQVPISIIAQAATNGQNSTAGAEALALYAGYGNITTATIDYVDPNDQCIAYISYPLYDWYWGPSTINPAGCTFVPPPTEMCKITTPELLLDHGSITLKDAEGHTAKTSMGVNCTTAMAVTFHLTTNQPYINLSPTGKSEIQVENLPLNSKIDLPSGTKILSVSDMLSGVSTEGVNAGSSVLVMEPY